MCVCDELSSIHAYMKLSTIPFYHHITNSTSIVRSHFGSPRGSKSRTLDAWIHDETVDLHQPPGINLLLVSPRFSNFIDDCWLMYDNV